MTVPNRVRFTLLLCALSGLIALIGGPHVAQANAPLRVPGELPAGQPTGDAPDAAPNLRPYVPGGWSFQVVPSSVTGTHTVDTLVINAPTYIDWAVVNDGSGGARGGIYFCLSLDGTEIARWYRYSLRASYYTYAEDFSHTLTSAGTHSLSITADCTNRIAESNESDNTWSGNFTWQGGGSGYGAVISNKQGFDKCEIPSSSQLQTWWDSSPYYEVNIYIGGASRACANSGLTAAWIAAANTQGWNFIPTWVGLQAPCSGFAHRMSSDPNTAYSQGRSEANSAAAAAGNLGLTAGGAQTIIYFDLEAFPNDSACRNAVKSFISGWSGRLRELGHRAGVYGSGCGSYVTDWAAITNVPDDVWPAHWIYSAYNADATVWGVACVSDSYWSNHQRIRQYTGGHNETWGGVTFNIDSDVLDGHVAGTHPRVLTAPTMTQAMTPTYSDQGWLTPDQGWVIADGQLVITRDGGQTWRASSSAVAQPAASAFFVDAQHGWVILGPIQGRSTVSLARTVDGGQTWLRLPDVRLPDDSGQAVAAAQLQFLDRQRGWLAVELATGVNFSLGRLYYTSDGGHTWTARALPVGGVVRFLDATTGWVAGGARGDSLYITRDSGRTWQAQGIVPAQSGGRTYYGLPHVTATSELVLPITQVDGDQARLRWYTSQTGATWQEATALTVATPLDQAAITAIADGQHWSVAGSEGVWLTDNAGQTWRLSALPGVSALGWSDAQHGWALSQTNRCGGDKTASDGEPWQCTSSAQLWRTVDGGQTWTGPQP